MVMSGDRSRWPVWLAIERGLRLAPPTQPERGHAPGEGGGQPIPFTQNDHVATSTSVEERGIRQQPPVQDLDEHLRVCGQINKRELLGRQGRRSPEVFDQRMPPVMPRPAQRRPSVGDSPPRGGRLGAHPIIACVVRGKLGPLL
jgi:hypothetical protein